MTAIPTWGLYPGGVLLRSRPRGKDGEFLAFSYKNFELGWHSGNRIRSQELDGTTHKEVLYWIRQISTGTHPTRTYSFKFHYDLLYPISDTFLFHTVNTGELRELMQLRSLAQRVLSGFLESNQLQSEIRVWPHHFDTDLCNH
jgi:hypothetical protein